MRKFMMLFSVFALLVSLSASLAHAEPHCNDVMPENCAPQHMDDTSDKDGSPDGCCDMSCGGCGMHHHISSHVNDALSLKVSGKDQRVLEEQQIYLSNLIYGLKRPPKVLFSQV